MWQLKQHVNILDFDIENRPLTYWYEGHPTVEITSISSCWAHDLGSMHVDLLGRDDPKQMLINFVDRYNDADIVTGHNIRRHDLPIINGALMEFGLPQLSSKMTIDTRWDLRKKGDIPASQEYLLDLFNIPIQKFHMSQHSWRKANRLSDEGIAITEQRVSSDVLGHMMLRNKLVELNLLGAPKVWKP
jgi:hypothetical protein